MTARWTVAACVLLGAASALAHAGPAGASSPGAIPYMADGPGTGELVWRVLGALVVCAAVGWVALRLLGRWTGAGAARAGLSRPARRLELLEVKPVGGRGRLLVVRYEGEQLLLAQSESGIALLHRGGGAPGSAP